MKKFFNFLGKNFLYNSFADNFFKKTQNHIIQIGNSKCFLDSTIDKKILTEREVNI